MDPYPTALLRDGLLEKLQPFRHHARRQVRHPRDVPTRRMHAPVRRRSEQGFRATRRSGLLTYFHKLLHSSHFAGFEPDLDAVWVVGRFREDVFHNPACEPPAALVLLLRDVTLIPALMSLRFLPFMLYLL